MIKISGVSMLVVFMLITLGATAQKLTTKTNIPFDFDWRFALNDHPGAEQPAFDDSKWQLLDVPHDYSIGHPFDSSFKTGAGGGYTYSGIGWYRKHFKTEADFSNKKFWILFDGIYRNSDAWINGHYLGIRPSHTPLNGNKMETWKGKCLAIIQSTGKKGEIKITARSGSLPVATTTLKAE